MKISLQWLSDYIDIREYFSKPQDLAALLTAAGIEVEGVQNLAKQFESVVIGSILKKDQHPNADRLSLCQVSTARVSFIRSSVGHAIITRVIAWSSLCLAPSCPVIS